MFPSSKATLSPKWISFDSYKAVALLLCSDIFRILKLFCFDFVLFDPPRFFFRYPGKVMLCFSASVCK